MMKTGEEHAADKSSSTEEASSALAAASSVFGVGVGVSDHDSGSTDDRDELCYTISCSWTKGMSVRELKSG